MHRSEATKPAAAREGKAASQSVGYVHVHGAAALVCKVYGVTVEQSVLDELSRLTRERWRPARLSRLSALGSRKSDQIDLQWSALVEYLGSQFAEDCRAAQPSQPTSIACERAGVPVAQTCGQSSSRRFSKLTCACEEAKKLKRHRPASMLARVKMMSVSTASPSRSRWLARRRASRAADAHRGRTRSRPECVEQPSASPGCAWTGATPASMERQRRQ